MKKPIIPTCVILALSLVVIVGSQTFLAPCAHEDGSLGACHWAGRALLGEGCLLAVLAAVALILGKERAGLYLAMIPSSVLGICTPGGLIALCKAPTMRCRMLMRPAMIILFAAMLVVALTGWLLARREAR